MLERLSFLRIYKNYNPESLKISLSQSHLVRISEGRTKKNKRPVLASCASDTRRDLNPHKHYCSQDFKSCVSTNSTIRACYCLKVVQTSGLAAGNIENIPKSERQIYNKYSVFKTIILKSSELTQYPMCPSQVGLLDSISTDKCRA